MATAKQLQRSLSTATDGDRARMVAILDQTNVDLQALCCAVARAHLNVRGDKAFGLHHLFHELSEHLCQQGRHVASIVEELGGESSGSVEELAAGTRLRPWPSGIVSGPEVGSVVADRVAALLGFIAQDRAALVAMGQDGAAHSLLHVEAPIAKFGWKIDAGLPSSNDVAELVHQQLLEDFPSSAVAWVHGTVEHQSEGVERFGSTGADIGRAADGTSEAPVAAET